MGSRADLRASLPEDLELPERYELVRRIATGGMATVWCAEDRVLGRRVAIKLLSERYAHDETAVSRFKREARVAARVSGHQSIVTIFDVGEAARPAEDDAPGQAFIVMEYLAGGTVADALRVGAVSHEEALRWLSETAAALDYAHGQRVIHRDIKPVNLLLDCDRVVHVADFGIARLGTEDSITNTGLVLGTAAYIAPEQALGRPATEASDRYALAVTAFELLVGTRPFGATQLAAQARQHVEEEPPRASVRNPELPPSVDDVLARGMAKRPEDRWPSAGAFAQALERALDEPATEATRAFAAVPPPRQRRAAAAAAPLAAAPAYAKSSGRRSGGRPLALAALAAVLVAVVMVATSLGGGGNTPRRTAATGRTTATHSTQAPAAAPTTPPPKPKPPVATTSSTSTTSTSPYVTGTAAAATTAAPTADTLEAQGHSLMTSGNYQAAIPVLRQALTASPKGSLTYAYAMYDLGRSLRLAGDPKDAAQVLWQRMQIPNQTETVRAELQSALQALGQSAQQSAGHAKHGGGGKSGG